RSAARSECRLAARATECAREVRGLAALQQHHNDQHEAVHHEKCRQKPACETESDGNDSKSDQQRNSPLHPARHCLLLILFVICAPSSNSQFPQNSSDSGWRLLQGTRPALPAPATPECFQV